MPRALISSEELQNLLLSILVPGQATYAVELLDACPDAIKRVAPSAAMPYERFFDKGVAYRDFEVHIRYFEAVGDTVALARLRLKTGLIVWM